MRTPKTSYGWARHRMRNAAHFLKGGYLHAVLHNLWFAAKECQNVPSSERRDTLAREITTEFHKLADMLHAYADHWQEVDDEG